MPLLHPSPLDPPVRTIYLSQKHRSIFVQYKKKGKLFKEKTELISINYPISERFQTFPD